MQEEKEMTEDETVGWHHRLDGREFKQASGDGEGRVSLECYIPRGCKESDTTEPLNNNNQGKTRAILVLKIDGEFGFLLLFCFVLPQFPQFILFLNKSNLIAIGSKHTL